MEQAPPNAFISKQRIYFDMIDQMRTLHNAAYLLVFERARTDLWRHLGVGYGAAELDWPYLVARNEINYRLPIETDCEAPVKVWVEKIGRSSITFGHEVYTDSGALAADGQTVIVRIDPETRKSREWSDHFRDMVKPFMR